MKAHTVIHSVFRFITLIEEVKMVAIYREMKKNAYAFFYLAKIFIFLYILDGFLHVVQ